MAAASRNGISHQRDCQVITDGSGAFFYDQISCNESTGLIGGRGMMIGTQAASVCGKRQCRDPPTMGVISALDIGRSVGAQVSGTVR
jgi:hypothetical protein